ncbi:malate dehydrogenase [Sporolactobacillus sp. Y61]|jgi:malate dehydrogenase|uniref:Malate dehydrogenase n=1 Tax=Sporolactobacillus sp. Y61 TaxID=3160863 RepID=A0AAU8IEH8_9BACL|nr:malate dehydrogenase [Sporolactobacillus sp. THM19-2]RYL94609.1 malate dehydrogenase [Sporolactobacillus sp. THM19-2]
MSANRKKVTVVGAGFTGSTTAFLLAQKELANVVLVDLPKLEKPVRGKALDMLESSPVQGFDTKITGTSDYARTADSDLVIITAGIARKPGMSREDLVSVNAGIMKEVTRQIVHYSPDCIIIVLSNPVDAMTFTVFRESGLPRSRVIGQSGVLDTARFRTFIAQELNVSVKDITGFVLGGHGDSMVPLIRYSHAGGVPVSTLISEEKLKQIIERTRKGGGEIVSLLGNGSAYYAPAAALCQMAEAVLKDQRRILPAIALLDGEYGYSGLYLGVPVILGKNGIEKVIELDLTSDEKSALDRSADSVRNVLQIM